MSNFVNSSEELNLIAEILPKASNTMRTNDTSAAVCKPNGACSGDCGSNITEEF